MEDQSILRRLRNSKGFTLIEIMVVLFIIALIVAMTAPSISNYFQVSISSAGREMSSIIKETYNSTMVTGRVHRIAYDFKEGKYWAESGPSDVLLDTKESRDRSERKKRFTKDTGSKSGPSFQLEKSITRKKMGLPIGVGFEDILTQLGTEAITEGVAYTHFFPHGMIEQTIIHLKDTSKHQFSLVILPVSGKTDLYERYVGAKEAFGGN